MITYADCIELDRRDPLRNFKKNFILPSKIIYFDGNSLGALPRDTPQRIAKVISNEWGKSLIMGWKQHGWMNLPKIVGSKISKLLGARSNEVIVADSTSINLFKLLSCALDLNPKRFIILTDNENFPTDIYIAQSLSKLRNQGHTVKIVDTKDILDHINEDVAVVYMSHINYRTGYMHDINSITSRAHAKGAIVLWDLSHTAGAVPINLGKINADFAVGCGYKYLNGGPGAPSFLFVAERHQELIRSPLCGWIGHKNPFDFALEYIPAFGITRHLCGTPSILSLVGLEVGVDLLLKIDFHKIRNKSINLTGIFMDLIEQECPNSFNVLTPAEKDKRGSQVCLSHDNGNLISQKLISKGIIVDYRPPNIIRFGLTPLYLSFEDVWRAVKTIKKILKEESL